MNPNTTHAAGAAAVLEHYGLGGARLEPIAAGWINPTWRVTAANGDRCVLQRVNRIFPVEIHDDIEAVSAHLEGKGLPTPRLIRTRAGALFVREQGEVWRALTYIDGETRSVVRAPAEAAEAGRLLGRFHAALADLDYRFRGSREGVHDTARHLARLREALSARRGHPRYRSVEPLARAILEAAAALPVLPPLRPRAVHGDPKISNILFERGSGRALCLIDLDTLARMPLPLELGDAFRSWCNPAGENARDGEFSAPLFEAGVSGYAETAAGIMERNEIDAILPGTLTIAVELAARFCTDALCEDYFGWDARIFASHSEHSEVRAAGQLSAATALRRQWRELARLIAKVFK